MAGDKKKALFALFWTPCKTKSVLEYSDMGMGMNHGCHFFTYFVFLGPWYYSQSVIKSNKSLDHFASACVLCEYS